MQNILLCSTAGILLAAIHAADASPVVRTDGSTHCVSLETDPTSCYVEWQWNSAPRAGQWVQVFDPSLKAKWRSIAEVPAASSGRTIDPVEQGNLYRVVTCEDPQVPETCISSTVLWAALRPTVDDIPPAFVNNKGEVFQIAKNLPYEMQVTQVNVIAMQNSLGKADLSGMPPMTFPLHRWKSKDFEPFDNVWNNAYDLYESLRMPQEESTEGTIEPAPREVRWIGDVPEDTQDAYRAAFLQGRLANDAITFPAVPEKYVVTVWSDLDCQHCRQLIRDLPAMNEKGITVRFVHFR